MHKLVFAGLIAALTFSSNLAMAHNLKLNNLLPEIVINSQGEIMLEKDKIKYQRWESDSLLGRVHVIQAIAGRTSAKAMNAPMIDAIKAQKFNRKEYQTTTIINKNDAVWGTARFVQSSAEDSKRAFHWASMVLDDKGKVAKAWQLTPKNSAIIVLNKQGKVKFVHEGALDKAKINDVITLINQLLLEK